MESEFQKAHTVYGAVIQSVQMTMKENMYGFQGNQKSPYLKISVTDPKFLNRARKLVEAYGANWKRLWPRQDDNDRILTFDNIQYVLRFMIDTKVSPHAVLRTSLIYVDLRYVMGGNTRWEVQDDQSPRATLELPN